MLIRVFVAVDALTFGLYLKRNDCVTLVQTTIHNSAVFC